MKKEIIATLGPSSLTREIVQKMDTLGVNIFRINLSHVSQEKFIETYKLVRQWTKKPVCPDTEGAQLRTGVLPNEIIHLSAGVTVRIGNSLETSGAPLIPLNYDQPRDLLEVGDVLRIDFNSVVAQVCGIDENGLQARIIKGGTVGSNKGISVDRSIKMPTFTEKDIAVCEIANDLQIDTIFLSFCSCGDDVIELRKKFDHKIKIISKVESSIALRNLASICEESDGILIDRGDLSRDVHLLKIAFAQEYILDTANRIGTPVYVATNLIESMIKNSEPTRAEVNDIVNALKSGAHGLVLAAETAVGAFPIECVRIFSNLMKEMGHRPEFLDINYLSDPIGGGIISPHGGALVNQILTSIELPDVKSIASFTVNERVESDIIQIARGVYSPLDRFMDLDEVQSVLEKNELLDGIVWPLPIILQLTEDKKKKLNYSGEISFTSERTGKIFAAFKINKLEKIPDMAKISKLWFGTIDSKHAGVKTFMEGGEYLLSGKPYLLDNYPVKSSLYYNLSPRQTRAIFSHNGWSEIIGYHTRNVPHRGHEFIQRKALEENNADCLFISPVTGIKKKGDFSASIILKSFDKLIENGVYDPYGVVVGAFETHSRYSGPREAIFTAICRKNFGCNQFIVGRDHTGVGNYYSPTASQEIFDKIDTGMKILRYDNASYCSRREIITDQFEGGEYLHSRIEISGSKVREMLLNGSEIPEYLLRPEIVEVIRSLLQNDIENVFI